jgi:hypothetical protein
LTSRDAKADRAIYDMARQQLPILEKKIKLGQQDEEGPNKLQWPIPLKMSLPLLVLDRKDPAESAFVRMLLNTEEGLDEIDGPILFAVFGRGRALPLYGKFLDEKNLRGLTEGLSGPCSCQIKDLNPGVDLLMAADWKAFQEVLFDGKEAVPLPREMPTSLPYHEGAPAPIENAVVTPKDVNSEPGKVDAQSGTAATRVAPAVQSPSIEASSEEKPRCELCFWLWIATGVAGGLVMITGGWVALVLMRK